MMRNRLKRFGEVGIVDETNGFELDCVKQTEWRTFRRATSDVGAVLKGRTHLGLVCS